MTDIDIVEKLRAESAKWAASGYEAAFLPFDQIEEAATLISQLRSRVEEMEGWKMVPIEPTEEMQQAGAYQVSGCTRVGAECVYHAMLARSPSPPMEIDGEKERG